MDPGRPADRKWLRRAHRGILALALSQHTVSPSATIGSVNAILAGASGLTGGHLAAVLAARQGWRLTALIRKPVSALPAAVIQTVCDFTRLDSLACVPADAVFCALGSTIAAAGSREAFRAVDYDAVLSLGRYGRRCGAQQFLLISSVAADPGSWNFYLRVKAEAERDLATLGYQSLHIFRPSFLLGERPAARWAESVGIAIARSAGWALAGPLAQYRGLEAGTVASAMVSAADTATPGTHIYHYREMIALAGSR